MLKQYVLPYRTAEDLAEVTALQDKFAAAGDAYTKAAEDLDEAWEKTGGDPDQEIANAYYTAKKTWDTLRAEINSIYKRAETRYIADFKGKGNPDEIRAAILGDIQDKITALDDQDHEDIMLRVGLEKSFAKKVLPEADATPVYYLAAEYIDELVTVQTDALNVYQVYDADTEQRIADLIADKLREWNEDVPEVMPARVIADKIKIHITSEIVDRGAWQDYIEGKIPRRMQAQAVTDDQTAHGLPYVRAIAPTQTMIAADALTRDLFRKEYGEDPIKTIMRNPRKRKEPAAVAVTSVRADLEDGELLTSIEKKYQECVINAISALYEDGNDYVSRQQIYRVLTGSKGAKLTPNQDKLLEKVIYAARHTFITTELTDVLKAYDVPDAIKKARKWNRETQLLYAEEDTFELHGGRAINGYHILQRPLNHIIAGTLKQITADKIDLLEVPTVSKTPEAIVMIYYLFGRVAGMKHNKKLSRDIVYKTVYDELEVPDNSSQSTKDKRKKIRDNIKDTLAFWTKRGWIAGWTEYKKQNRKELHGVKILLSEELEDQQKPITATHG